MLLRDKVAIVSGGGRGIGRAIALRLAAEGAAVAVTARSVAQLADVAEEIERQGGKAAAIAADVTKQGECERILKGTHEELGGVDILVNNAGIYGPVLPVEEISTEEWDEVMAVNLRGPFLLARMVLPEMYERGSGAILNVLSVAAKIPFPWNGPYATSKAGLAGLTRTLAAEAGRKGVRVNGISPGPVPETAMSQELGRALAARMGMDAGKMLEEMLGGVLQGRAQTAEEIAAAAAFLVSEEARAITGQILNVDGGMAFY